MNPLKRKINNHYLYRTLLIVIFSTFGLFSTNSHAASFNSNTVLNLDPGSVNLLCLLGNPLETPPCGGNELFYSYYDFNGSYFGSGLSSTPIDFRGSGADLTATLGLFSGLSTGNSIRIDSNSQQFSQLPLFPEGTPTDAASRTLTANLTTVIDDFGQVKMLDISSWLLGTDGLHSLSGPATLTCDLVTCDHGSRFTLDSTGLALGLSGETDISYNFHFEGTISSVPVPAATWLFGSGLIGLIGLARHKKA